MLLCGSRSTFMQLGAKAGLRIQCVSVILPRDAMSNSPRRFTKLSLLMAAYNEEATLRRCAEWVLTAPLPVGLDREIVLVDDGSTDATWEIAQRLATGHREIRIF